MALNYKDVELMNQSFGNLADTILRSRQLKSEEQARGQELGFRQQELADRELAMRNQMDPNTPENQARLAQAKYNQTKASQLENQPPKGDMNAFVGSDDGASGVYLHDTTWDRIVNAQQMYKQKTGKEAVIRGEVPKDTASKAPSQTFNLASGKLTVYGQDAIDGVQAKIDDGTLPLAPTETETTQTTTGKINPVTGQTAPPETVTTKKTPVSAIPDQLAPSKNGGAPKRWRYTGRARTLAEAKKDSANWKSVQ